MSGKLVVQFVLIVALVFITGVVLADFISDSKGGMNANLSFSEPTDELISEESYKFVFTVLNSEALGKAKKNEWIYKIDLMMPSMNYAVDEGSISVPDAVHSSTDEGQYRIDHWESSFETASNTITWQSIAGIASATYGDVREGETQSFHFVASTDSAANNVFYWVIYGDQDSVVTGLSVVGQSSSDDDDDTSSDDDETDDDEEDDDDSTDNGNGEDDDEDGEEDCCSS